MTRGQAVARLASVQPRPNVSVDEFTENSSPRLRYRYSNPDGLGVCTIETDAESSDSGLVELVTNLLIPPGARANAVAILRGGPP